MTRKNVLHASICALAISVAFGAQGADINYDQYGDYAKYGAAADVPGACPIRPSIRRTIPAARSRSSAMQCR